MTRRFIVAVAVTAIMFTSIMTLEAEAGSRKRCQLQQCCVAVPCVPVAQCAAPAQFPAADQALPPINVEQQIQVQRAVTEDVIGTDGKPRKVTKMLTEMKTQTVTLTTANQQIRYLNEQLNKIQKEKVDLEKFKQLEEGKVDPLKALVDTIRATFTPDKK